MFLIWAFGFLKTSSLNYYSHTSIVSKATLVLSSTASSNISMATLVLYNTFDL